MKKKDEVFVVHLRCTPYVKKYLMDNFGVMVDGMRYVVDIRSDQYLNAVFSGGLTRHSEREERRLESAGNHNRNVSVKVMIGYDKFVRYGWALSLTEENRLNRLLESRVKGMLLGYLSAMYGVYGNLQTCIRRFYDVFGYDDEIWPSDSIRKIWHRAKNIPKISTLDEFSLKISSFFVEHLSKVGTTSQQGTELAMERIENLKNELI